VVGKAGDEEAVHSDGEEAEIALEEAGEGEGDGFVFGKAVEVGGSEGDIEGLAGGAGGADPFADLVRRDGPSVFAGDGELVFGGEGELVKGGVGGEIEVAVEGAGGGVLEVSGEASGLEGAPFWFGEEEVGAVGGHWRKLRCPPPPEAVRLATGFSVKDRLMV
jgi:hypothetical protein